MVLRGYVGEVMLLQMSSITKVYLIHTLRIMQFQEI